MPFGELKIILETLRTHVMASKRPLSLLMYKHRSKLNEPPRSSMLWGGFYEGAEETEEGDSI